MAHAFVHACPRAEKATRRPSGSACAGTRAVAGTRKITVLCTCQFPQVMWSPRQQWQPAQWLSAGLHTACLPRTLPAQGLESGAVEFAGSETAVRNETWQLVWWRLPLKPLGDRHWRRRIQSRVSQTERATWPLSKSDHFRYGKWESKREVGRSLTLTSYFEWRQVHWIAWLQSYSIVYAMLYSSENRVNFLSTTKKNWRSLLLATGNFEFSY
jgi:hypothetical protein